MKRFVGLILLLLTLAALPAALPGRTAGATLQSSWVWIAGGATDSFGSLDILRTIPSNPANNGLVYAKVTSGSCDDFPDEAITLEGQGAFDSSGSFDTLIYPVGAPAKAFPELALGVVHIGPFRTEPPPAGHFLVAGFVGGPVARHFNVCLRPPGPFCVPYDDEGGQICQAQYPVAPSALPPATISAGGPYSGAVNAPLTFTATVDHIPAGLGYAITWSFGDGATATGGIVSHAYTTPGIYQVTVSLTFNISGLPPFVQHTTTATITGTPVILVAPPSEIVIPSPWVPIGVAAPDEGGAWRFNTTTRRDLIGAGLTVLRVTSGACTTPPDQAYVFEAQLRPTEGEDRAWDGKLLAVGGPARSLPGFDPAGGDVHFLPVPAGTLIDAALDGLPPLIAFSVCVRAP